LPCAGHNPYQTAETTSRTSTSERAAAWLLHRAGSHRFSPRSDHSSEYGATGGAGGTTNVIAGELPIVVAAGADVPYQFGDNSYGVTGGAFLAKAPMGSRAVVPRPASGIRARPPRLSECRADGPDEKVT